VSLPRRRWLTLAELIAVAGLAVAALTLWTGWSDRRADDAERRAAVAGEARSRSRLALTATVADDGDRLTLSGGDHEIAELHVAFPSALGVPDRTPPTPVIDAIWFRDALLRATDGGPDGQQGVVPVLLTTRYWDGEASRTAIAIYDVVWATEGRMLRGRSLRLTAMRLRARGGDRAALNRAWKRALEG